MLLLGGCGSPKVLQGEKREEYVLLHKICIALQSTRADPFLEDNDEFAVSWRVKLLPAIYGDSVLPAYNSALPWNSEANLRGTRYLDFFTRSGEDVYTHCFSVQRNGTFPRTIVEKQAMEICVVSTSRVFRHWLNPDDEAIFDSVLAALAVAPEKHIFAICRIRENEGFDYQVLQIKKEVLGGN